MVNGYLKNTGRLLTAVIMITVFCITASAAEIRSELSRSRIAEGESTTLKVMISGTTSDIRPVKVPAVNGLNINLTGTSRSFQFVNGRSWTGIILNFSIEAEKKGVYRIPRFIIEADGNSLETKEFVLTVDKGETGGSVSYGLLRGEVELTATEIYAGEPVIMRYYLSSDSAGVRIQGIKAQPESKGFVIKRIKENDSDEPEVSGDGRIYIASYCLVAAESGKHNIGGGALSVIVETGGDLFSRLAEREIKFPKKTVSVKALPSENRPEKFNGDVGEFTIHGGEASGSFREGEEIRIPVKVQGRGNLLMMSKPVIENQEGIKLLVEESEPKLSVDKRTLAGEKDYTVTIIPEREGICNIGRIFLPYFNPYKGVYEKAESSPFSFTISAAGTGNLSSDDKTGVEEKSSLPRVILIAAIILILVCGAILYLQSGKYRIVKAESVHNKKDEPETAVIDHKNNIREEFKKAYTERDHQSFLQKSEKMAEIIIDDSKDRSVIDELKKVKEKISLYRYGGASLEDEEMKSIYEVLKKLS